MADQGFLSEAAVLNHAPAVDEFGQVVRVVGTLPVAPAAAAVAATTTVAAAMVSTLLLAANANRLGYTIRNTSTTDTLYVLMDVVGPVSAGYHTVALIPGTYYEDPYRYVGNVWGIWTGLAGTALITEFTP